MSDKSDKSDTIEKRTAENKKRVLEFLKKSMGLVSIACKNAGIHRSTFYEWCNSDPQFKEESDYLRNEYVKDFVEARNYENIEKHKEASIIFYLKTKCRDRGYAEKFDIEGPPPLIVNVKSEKAKEQREKMGEIIKKNKEQANK